MAIFYDEIPDKFLEWIARQKMFWVATAALDGHVNVSPKGSIETFHVTNKNSVWYEDMTGSVIVIDNRLPGVETIAHIREPGNGRVTIMFHEFEAAPRILRFWGTGTVYEFGTPDYDALIPATSRKPGSRAAIVVNVHKVATSCGFGIPRYQFLGQRSQLERWCDSLEKAEAKVSPREIAPNGIKAWWGAENTHSIDGLPALEQAHNSAINVESSYNSPHTQEETDEQITPTLPPPAKFFDERVVVAFSIGMATTLVVLKLAALRVH